MAAYFALGEEKDSTADGSVWMLAPGSLNRQCIGYFVPFLTDERVKPIVSDAFGTRMGHSSPECVAVLAPRSDKRMAAQLGNYTIHRTREPLEASANADNFCAQVVVPASARKRLRSELSIAGVRRSSLFPDLANLAAELTQIVAIDDDENEPPESA